jgi:hypothetical protein
MASQAANTEPAVLVSRAYRALPAIVSLLYPGLVWCGPAVYPPLLLLSLLPTVLCLAAARRLGVVTAHLLCSAEHNTSYVQFGIMLS